MYSYNSAQLNLFLALSGFLNLVLQHLVNLSCSVLHFFDAVYLWSTCPHQCFVLSGGQILGRNQGKSHKSFPPCYSQSSPQLPMTWDFYSLNLIENHIPFPMAQCFNLPCPMLYLVILNVEPFHAPCCTLSCSMLYLVLNNVVPCPAQSWTLSCSMLYLVLINAVPCPAQCCTLSCSMLYLVLLNVVPCPAQCCTLSCSILYLVLLNVVDDGRIWPPVPGPLLVKFPPVEEECTWSHVNLTQVFFSSWRRIRVLWLSFWELRMEDFQN